VAVCLIIIGFVYLCFEAIRRKENGWYDEEHPLVFLFLGSSGIGTLWFLADGTVVVCLSVICGSRMYCD